ncbi:AIPR family protein [Roseibium aestuarii]|uniref:AIPR family protein n=1 Tax=Roseibium aestuarii TaxID=2600299 RepID=A0ABW4JTU7_9HYPH|nr:AIPR family protein [Roseibium aestuarii]
MSELEEFHHQLIADIQGDADAFGLITSEAFFEKIGELITEAGEIDSASRAYFDNNALQKRIQLDGYGGDPRDCDGILSLILCDFELGKQIRTIDKAKIERLVNRVYRFLEMSRKHNFREELEETSAAFGVADLIASTWKQVEKVQLLIISNADARGNADAIKISEINGVPVTFSLWDLKRIKKYMDQGQARANLSINFEKDFGGGIPLLRASGGDGSLESYLAVIPGQQLSKIYDKWGPRLLEANVRSFLQARGKVNRGIRDTIRDEPKMFFSYNNGLSATASNVEIRQTENGLELQQAENLQIVNGGQTTASIHAARKTLAEQIGQVHVQMKLTIVPPEQSERIVPKISEFANSQNKVNAADFFANHPFHIKVEELSRRILAPARTDNYRETKWFYERARGQFADERSRRTDAEKKKFDAEFPRSQFLTKTDLAKFENTWSGLPYIVSCGAQKNFGEFAKSLEKRWGEEGTSFDELWFKRLIAKAIVFKRTETLISNAEWYEGGYRANIVTYSIAKLVHDAEKAGMVLDLDQIWRRQEISDDLRSVLSVAGEQAQETILNPLAGVRNLSEWAKKQACWNQLRSKSFDYPEEQEHVLVPIEIAKETERAARASKAVDAAANAQILVHQYGADYWASAVTWARQHGLLTPRDIGILETCAAIPRRMPTDKQCALAITALTALLNEGFSQPSLEKVG